jgi:hypothetical protein
VVEVIAAYRYSRREENFSVRGPQVMFHPYHAQSRWGKASEA